jgi:hypothetical protein
LFARLSAGKVRSTSGKLATPHEARLEDSMSAQGNSFLYWLVSRMAQGATPVDGVLWVDPQATQRAQREPSTQRLESPFHVQIPGCDDCPSPIF